MFIICWYMLKTVKPVNIEKKWTGGNETGHSGHVAAE